MKAFLDFEASSLSDRSHPIEVAWVFEDGRSESHLIAPAPGWTDWDLRAQAIHGIAPASLVAEGEPHEVVAARMVEALTGHDLFASAPSWDGKWLSTLLRAGGQPRHALRLRDTDDAMRDTVTAILRPVIASERLDAEVQAIVAAAKAMEAGQTPAHRALADALGEYHQWLEAGRVARDRASANG